MRHELAELYLQLKKHEQVRHRSLTEPLPTYLPT